MHLSEAKDNLKTLRDSLTIIINATEGIKDSDFDQLQKLKENLDAAVADAQKRAIAASNTAEESIAKAKEKADGRIAEINKQAQDSENFLANLRASTDVQRETMRTSIQNERAQLLAAKQAEIKKLDEAIAARGKTLAEISAAIEEGRRKFA